MSSTSLASSHTRPDRKRVAAISVAITVNLIVFVIASRPISPRQLTLTQSPQPIPLIRLIELAAPVQPPPPIALKPLPHPASMIRTPAAPVIHAPAAAPVPMPVAAQAPASTAIPAPTEKLAPTVTQGPPVEASLAYRSAPLTFPMAALRQHLQGTVLLRVWVDKQGQPLAVKVEHSSGYPVLDHSAREQVLAHWRFHPAVINGHAAQAWARVPVTFVLNSP